MIKLENAGLHAPRKMSLNDRAPGSRAEISGLQGSKAPGTPPPFGTLIISSLKIWREKFLRFT